MAAVHRLRAPGVRTLVSRRRHACRRTTGIWPDRRRADHGLEHRGRAHRSCAVRAGPAQGRLIHRLSRKPPITSAPDRNRGLLFFWRWKPDPSDRDWPCMRLASHGLQGMRDKPMLEQGRPLVAQPVIQANSDDIDIEITKGEIFDPRRQLVAELTLEAQAVDDVGFGVVEREPTK